MKNLFVLNFVLLAILFVGCSEKNEKLLVSETDYYEDGLMVESNPVQDVVFCEGSDIYMVPREDPYTLSNFKEALARIVNGDSQIALPENLTKSSFDDLELSPTHYALKIYPRNEKEQWAVELLEDVKMAYIPFDYVQVHDLIKESFASYVGWLSGNKFYTDKGYTGNLEVIGHQSRQSWRKTYNADEDGGLYSPLFVDLVDDYNQGATNSALPVDRINNFPNSIIMTIAEEDYNWSKVKSRLNSYVGAYYTSSDMNTYLSNYDYWFNNN